MKIIYKAYAGGGDREFTISDAIEQAAIPDAYSYEGQLEKQQAEIQKLREIVSKLVECIYGEQKPKHEALEHILGYGYEVEE